MHKVDNSRDVYIWGAGQYGQDTYNNLKDKIVIKGFIDGDPLKWNTTQCNLLIFGPEILDLKNKTNKPFVIIASMWANEIEIELKVRGYQWLKDFLVYSKSRSDFETENEIFVKNDYDFSICIYNKKEEEISQVGDYNGAVLCIGENNPGYFMKLKNLFLSINGFGGTISRLERIVYFMGTPEPKYQKELEEIGVKIIKSSPVNPKYPHNNKIRLLEQDLGYDWYILLDHDTIVCRDFSRYLNDNTFKAKPVDAAIIKNDLWEKIYKLFDLECPTEQYLSTSTADLTLPFFNSGVLIIPGLIRKNFYETWLYYAKRLIALKEQVSNFTFYIDEIAQSLTLQKNLIRPTPLPVEMNFHTHIPVNESFHPETIIPFIIHYHNLINESGFIKPSCYPGVQRKIAEFNELLKQSRQASFNNEAFWDFRYAEYPNYGSGVGSRGETLVYKQNILKKIVNKENPETILDIGCGDQFVSSVIPDDKYVGLDLSKVVIERNANMYPNRIFINANFLNIEMTTFDMTICFDVLIHIDQYGDYRNFVERIVKCTRRSGIISGFESYPTTYHSELTFYHEPLSKTLRDFGVSNLQLLGNYRDLALWYFEKTRPQDSYSLNNNTVNKEGVNNISEHDLNILRSQSEDRILLDKLVSISRENFGFFAKHTARAFEYVWVTKLLKDFDLNGKNILDIGTGINPLPIYFALCGANVYTLDNSKMIRTWEQDLSNWNEWGYLDYNIKYNQIHSFNVDMNSIWFKKNFFDVIYSVSVIEHIPSIIRKQLWGKFRSWIKDNGILLLTIDLYKRTSDLWNYCYGELVEERKIHGNLDEIVMEVKPYFNFNKLDIKKDIYGLDKLDIGTLIGIPQKET